MQSFDELLEFSVKQHGHLCAGQVIGVRMAMLGLKLIGIDEPRSNENRKKFIVYVEIDRCATDAISSVTGVQLGKRTLKFPDYGINAATFVHLITGEAYRVISTEESRDLVKKYAPDETDPRRQQLLGYQNMPDELLFDVQRVKVDIPLGDMPGPAKKYAVCSICGQVVRDGREIETEKGPICRPCSELSYFQIIEKLTTDEINAKKQD